MVAQVDEQHAAMVADAVAPAGEPHVAADVAVAQRAAGMAAIAVHRHRPGFSVCGHSARKAREKRMGGALCQGKPAPRQRRYELAPWLEHGESTKRPRSPRRRRRMTTAEAAVGALLAHGLDTIYALPGVHNDHLFDALAKARRRRGIRVIHTRHEQGAAYMALGAALATGKPQAYCVVPGPGLLNSAAALLTAYGMNAPVLALIGQIPQAAIGRGARPSARDPRPGRHHRAAGRLLRAHPRRRARRRASSPRRCARWHAAGPVRPRSNAPWMSGAARPGRARSRRFRPRARADRRRRAAQAAAKRLGAAKRR